MIRYMCCPPHPSRKTLLLLRCRLTPRPHRAFYPFQFSRASVTLTRASPAEALLMHVPTALQSYEVLRGKAPSKSGEMKGHVKWEIM